MIILQVEGRTDYLYFSWYLCSLSKACEQHWFKSVSAAIFNKTKGRRCVRSHVKLPHEFYVVCVCVCLNTQWFQGTNVVLFAFLGCAWQFLTCVMSYVDTEIDRVWEWLVHTGTLLQESMLTAFVLTPCMSQSFKVHILYTYCMSLAKNDTDSHQIRQFAWYNYTTYYHFFSAPAL